MIGRLLRNRFRADMTPNGEIDRAAQAEAPPEFRATIAHLSPAEQARRIDTRQRYRRFAERQRLIEIEERADRVRNS